MIFGHLYLCFLSDYFEIGGQVLPWATPVALSRRSVYRILGVFFCWLRQDCFGIVSNHWFELIWQDVAICLIVFESVHIFAATKMIQAPGRFFLLFFAFTEGYLLMNHIQISSNISKFTKNNDSPRSSPNISKCPILKLSRSCFRNNAKDDDSLCLISLWAEWQHRGRLLSSFGTSRYVARPVLGMAGGYAELILTWHDMPKVHLKNCELCGCSVDWDHRFGSSVKSEKMVEKSTKTTAQKSLFAVFPAFRSLFVFRLLLISGGAW